jgi:hypothetical protein
MPVFEIEKYMKNLTNISQIVQYLGLSCQPIIDTNLFMSKAYSDLLEMENAIITYNLDIDITTIKNSWHLLTVQDINKLYAN